MTTNILPDGIKDFSSLSGSFADPSASYILLSDFDTAKKPLGFTLPANVSLVGLGSSAGDTVRYANGVVYYDEGKSVFSARNDALANSLGAHYIAVSQLGSFSLHNLVFPGILLPLSQQILLYVLLGVLVILAILL